MEKVKIKKQKTEDIFRANMQTWAYCSYLRRELDKSNRENGVSAKLLEIACLQRALSNLTKTRDTIALSCSEDFDPVKGADYYKTSFTDTQKMYTLSVKMFAASDLAAIEAEIEKQKAAINALNDEVALINQTTMVEIRSFEEFNAKSK